MLQRCAAKWTGVPMMWWGVYVFLWGVGGWVGVQVLQWCAGRDVDQCCNGIWGVCVCFYGVLGGVYKCYSGVLGCGPALQQCVGVHTCVSMGRTSVVMVCWDVDQCCNSVLGCICVSMGRRGVYKCCNGVLGCGPALQWYVVECIHVCFCGVLGCA